MIGIGQQYLRAAFQQIFATLRSNGRMRTYGHEGGREHFVMPRRKARCTGTRACGSGLEREMQPPAGGVRHLAATLAAVAIREINSNGWNFMILDCKT